MRVTLLMMSGFLLTVSLAEAVLRMLPVSTGYTLRTVDAQNPVLRGTSRSTYTYSRGWNMQLSNSGVLNNQGFRASYDYLPDRRALVVIGNSFVQADAVAPRYTFSERLGAMLGRPAYGVGSDGFSLADYLTASRWSIDEFQSRTVLILLTTGDLRHACVTRAGQSHLRVAEGRVSLALVYRNEPSPLKRLINRSQLFRYIFDNLRLTANWDKGWRRTPERAPDPDTVASDFTCGKDTSGEAATNFLLAAFAELELNNQARVIFVLAPGYRREQGVAAGARRDVDEFADRAEIGGFRVVRLEDAFAASLRSGVRLDFMPIDGHWNVEANSLAARTVAAALSADAP